MPKLRVRIARGQPKGTSNVTVLEDAMIMMMMMMMMVMVILVVPSWHAVNFQTPT